MFQKVPKCPETIPEASGRSWKVPKGSLQYHLLRPPPSLGGKPAGLALDGQEVEGHQGGGIVLQVELQSSLE